MYKLILIFVFPIFSLVLSATNVPKRNVSQTNLSESGPDAKTRLVFVFKTSTNESQSQRCQCKEYHLCHRDDIYDPNLNQGSIRCNNQMHVCCILKNDEKISTTSSPSNSRIMVKALSSQETSTDDPCTCVTFDKCSNQSYVENYGDGIILVRLTVNQPCDVSEVCCPNMYIIGNEDITSTSGTSPIPEEPENVEPVPQVSVEPPVDAPETSSDPVPVQSVTTDSNVEESFIPTQPPQTQCSCVPIDSCKNDSDTALFGLGAIDVRITPNCGINEVCCPVSNVVTEMPPVPPGSSENGNSTNVSSEWECGLKNGVSTSDSSSSTNDTSFGEYPWMIAILKKDDGAEKAEMICGGSLVSPNMVLTAAHCVRKIDLTKLIIRAGEYNYELEADQEQQPHQDRSVGQVRIHPYYKEGVYFNDMALLIVDKEFDLKSHISPICLPLINSNFAVPNIYDPSKCIATGWGKEAHGDSGTFRNSLKKVDLSLVNHDECQVRLRRTKLGAKFILHSSFICAGGEPGKDTCQGDGGGPLFCAIRDKPNRYVQVGIISWGLSCGLPIPAVYANVKANAQWLTLEINVSTIFSARNATDGTN